MEITITITITIVIVSRREKEKCRLADGTVRRFTQVSLFSILLLHFELLVRTVAESRWCVTDCDQPAIAKSCMTVGERNGYDMHKRLLDV